MSHRRRLAVRGAIEHRQAAGIVKAGRGHAGPVRARAEVIERAVDVIEHGKIAGLRGTEYHR
jgi:hypothetical protein